MTVTAGFAHEPVMRDEVLSWLVGNKTGVYVDGTIGGEGTPSRSWRTPGRI